MIMAELHAARRPVDTTAATNAGGAAVEVVGALLAALEQGGPGAPSPAFWAAFWPTFDRVGGDALTPVFVALGHRVWALRSAHTGGGS